MTSEPIPQSEFLPISEPIRKPDLYVRKSKTHIPKKDECVVSYRRNRKQKAGKVQSGCRYLPESEVPFHVREHYQSQDITEPAFSKPSRPEI